MNLTVAYITGRSEPRFDWAFDSLLRQAGPDDEIKIIVVDMLANERPLNIEVPKGCIKKPSDLIWTKPKPTIWQGERRITKENWWAASNARNTALCLCRTDWIAFLDDRCVLEPTWLQSVREAMKDEYAVAGSYQKVVNLSYENGEICFNPTDGNDPRFPSFHDARLSEAEPKKCSGQWWFGCTNALPLAWALQINGYEELMDGLGFEDCIFGLMLENNKFPICYDPRMRVVQDRSPGTTGPVQKKTDKGKSPKDKSHAALNRFGKLQHSEHPWNLTEIRASVLAGNPFPAPDQFPRNDWYDGQPIAEMT